jgi:hypothetical protein
MSQIARSIYSSELSKESDEQYGWLDGQGDYSQNRYGELKWESSALLGGWGRQARKLSNPLRAYHIGEICPTVQLSAYTSCGDDRFKNRS